MDNKLKIINYLGKMYRQEYTMHNLSKILKIPYASFHRTVSKMSDLIKISQVGKSKTLALNIKNTIVESYLAISSEEERKEYLEKKPIIKEIQKDLDTKDVVVLFGSYAKDNEQEKSDIDLMIINKSGEKSISFSKQELIFRKEINPMFFSFNEFKAMLKDDEENVGKQALKGHIILNNPKKFWEVVISAVR